MNTLTLKHTRPAVIELHFENKDGQVRVVPSDSDIMVVPVEMAVEACRAFNKQIVFKNQFDLLNHRLAEWLDLRTDSISAAYLTPRDAGLLFLVVLTGTKRDNELECALTELDLEIANDKDFNLISLTVHAIPLASEDTVQSFLSRKFALRYVLNGESERSHRLRESDAEDDCASSD